MKTEIEKYEPDGYEPSKEEMEEMELGFQLWQKELAEAIASGDQSRIDEVWECGK